MRDVKRYVVKIVVCVCLCVCVYMCVCVCERESKNHVQFPLPSQVCWQNNDMDGNMNFYSVSSDGRVVMWKLVKNELQYQDAVQLKIPGASVDGPEGIQQQALSELVTHVHVHNVTFSPNYWIIDGVYPFTLF